MNHPLKVLMVAGTLLATLPANAVTLNLSPDVSSVPLGNPVQVELRVSGLGAGTSPSLGAYDFTLAFNPAVLAFAAFTFGDPLLGNQLDLSGFGTVSGFDGGTSGQLSAFEVSLDLAGDLDALQAASFALGTISFKTVANGLSTLQFTSGVWSDATGNPLHVQLGSGSIQVPEPVPVGWTAELLMTLLCASGIRWKDTRH